jgi:hypothetical protein
MKKMAILVLAGGSILLGGCWSTLHELAIHVSDFTQFYAALDQLGTV